MHPAEIYSAGSERVEYYHAIKIALPGTPNYYRPISTHPLRNPPLYWLNPKPCIFFNEQKKTLLQYDKYIFYLMRITTYSLFFFIDL